MAVERPEQLMITVQWEEELKQIHVLSDVGLGGFPGFLGGQVRQQLRGRGRLFPFQLNEPTKLLSHSGV